jgi:hypothetical protein
MAAFVGAHARATGTALEILFFILLLKFIVPGIALQASWTNARRLHGSLRRFDPYAVARLSF